MSSEKSLTPQIRFKGFTEAWEQRKLGDIAAFSKGQGFSKSNLTDSGFPIILYGRLYTNYETQICKVATFVKSSSCGVLSKAGEVFVPASGETAEDIAVASHVSLPGILLGGDLNVVTPKDNLDSNFLALFITFGNAHVELSKRAQGKSVVHVRNGDLSQLNIKYPTQSEQILISNLFIKNDNLITLHQRKLDALKKIKSALLEKMFPKDGSNIPEIRFTGFTEVWEQRKFSDLTDEVIEKTITEDEDILLSCAITGIYTNSEYFSHFRGRSNIGYLKVKRNMLILSAQNLHLGNANVNLKFDHGIISPAYKTFDLKNWNPVFANAWIKRPRANKFWDNATTAGASLCRKNIVWKDLAEQIIYIPAIEKEQRQIGSIFELFDNLITLHQREHF